VRGDANTSGTVDIGDAIFILNFLFKGGPQPACLDAADADDSANPESAIAPITLNDPVLLLRWLLLGGKPPPPPTPLQIRAAPHDCGYDRQFQDGLGCERYTPCESP